MIGEEPGGTPLPARWSERTALLVGAGSLSLGFAIYLHNVALVFLALPLLVAPLSALASIPSGSPRGAVEWAASGGGREVIVEGAVRFSGAVPTEGISLDFPPPHPLVLTEPGEMHRDGAELRFRRVYRADFPCLAILPRPVASWKDPLGLVERPIPVDGAALRLERFPPEALRLKATHLRRTTVFPGEVRSRHRGGAGDFFSIRPSGPGDTPRQINWPASAKAGRLLANDYLLERTGDLLIILDLRPTSLGPRRDADLLSMSRAAALGVASAFLAEKARVGLATFDEYLSAIPLGTGRLQRYRIRTALLAARVGEVAGPAERLAVSIGRYFPKGLSTLVISALADDEGPLMLAHLRRRGFSPFVLAPSPIPLVLARSGRGDRTEELALRLMRLARRQRLAAAWKEAPIIEWEDYWSLDPLVRFLAKPSIRSGSPA